MRNINHRNEIHSKLKLAEFNFLKKMKFNSNMRGDLAIKKHSMKNPERNKTNSGKLEILNSFTHAISPSRNHRIRFLLTP